MVRAQEVAKTLDGSGIYTTSRMVQSAHTVIRLPYSVLMLVQEFSNMIVAALCFHSERLNSVGAKTVNEFMTIADCRIYLKFKHSSLLKAATVFMRASIVNREVAQLNAIHRYQFVCKHTDFKPVTAEVVSSVFKSTQWGWEEKKIFFYWKQRMAQEMETVRYKLS